MLIFFFDKRLSLKNTLNFFTSEWIVGHVPLERLVTKVILDEEEDEGTPLPPPPPPQPPSLSFEHVDELIILGDVCGLVIIK